jgi:hypothetical protein
MYVWLIHIYIYIYYIIYTYTYTHTYVWADSKLTSIAAGVKSELAQQAGSQTVVVASILTGFVASIVTG